MEFVLELNTKNLDNSTSFLTITHTTLSAKQFRIYVILTINVAVVLCFWIEQRWDGSSISSPGLTKTLEVSNTILDDSSLRFPTV
jgi:hypothetical protein